ncbi:hypothetical protein ACHAXH_001955 [Discostella pseudostelligera]
MTLRIRRVVSLMSQASSLRLRGPAICRSRLMIPSSTKTAQIILHSPFSSGTNISPIDLRIITPPLISSTRNAHSKPCFTLSEKRMMGVMTPEEVEKRIDRIMRLASDARLCMQDCKEFIATDHYNEELHFAKIAVDATGVAYSELLEELALSAEGVEVLNEVRKLYAPMMESLKQELNKISKPKEEED